MSSANSAPDLDKQDTSHVVKNSHVSRSAVYNLMLDSQVEVTSVDEEGKIIFTKAAKKRKRSLASATASSTISPSSMSKSAVVSAYEAAINSGESENIKKYLEQYCHSTLFSLVFDFSASSNPLASIYREVKGLDAVKSYLDAATQATPDSIIFFWQKSVVRQKDGSKEIHTECHYTGRRMYDIEIHRDEVFETEHSQLETALTGLMSLASKNRDSPSASLTSESAGESPLLLPPTASTSFPTTGDGYISMETMKLLVADSNCKFRKGKRLLKEFVINQKGSMTWFINADNQVTKMKFIVIA